MMPRWFRPLLGLFEEQSSIHNHNSAVRWKAFQCDGPAVPIDIDLMMRHIQLPTLNGAEAEVLDIEGDGSMAGVGL
jgi:hypothetical protein